MTEDERRMLELIRRTARGEDPSAGRDEVVTGPRIQVGGFAGRALACSTTRLEGGCVSLRAGGGELVFELEATGELIFTHGTFRISVIAANEALQVLATYAYWPSDATWAVGAWETFVSTLRLAHHRRS